MVLTLLREIILSVGLAYVFAIVFNWGIFGVYSGAIIGMILGCFIGFICIVIYEKKFRKEVESSKNVDV